MYILILYGLRVKKIELIIEKYKKLRKLLAAKVLTSDPKNEDFDKLKLLDDIELYGKYEKINEVATKKIEDISEKLNHVKIKFSIHKKQKKYYEELLDRIMNVLKFPSNDRKYSDILQKIENLFGKEWRETLFKLHKEIYVKTDSKEADFTKITC